MELRQAKIVLFRVKMRSKHQKLSNFIWVLKFHHRASISKHLVKQSKQDLVQTIDKIRIQIEMVSSETFSLDEMAEHLPKTNELDEKTHEKFLS